MNAQKITNFIVSILFTTTIYGTNKIVYLISPPRSLSVAFLRMMQARGDFSIMNEPSQLAFNIFHGINADRLHSWYRPAALRSFDQVKASIVQEAECRNVFVKEMSFAVRDFHSLDFELMRNPDVYFVFLVRCVHHTTLSMYNKVSERFDSLVVPFEDLIGYKSLYEIFTIAQHQAVNKPYLIKAEDLYTNPHKTIQKLCDHIGIAFKPESLHWHDLGENFDGQEAWHEVKYPALIQHWHSDAIKSTGFGKPTPYAVDEQGNPTFAEITNSEHRRRCQQVYLQQMVYYRNLFM